MISPIQVQYIFALLKHSSFQKAAEACHVTQPTLSMQIKKAEDSIGYPIIDRAHRSISLTKAGRILYPALLAIDDAYAQLDIEIQKLQGEYKSEINIGIIPTISNYLVPELYAQWQEKIGTVHLDFTEYTTRSLIEAVENKKVDLGIMAGPLRHSKLETQILYDEEIFIYAPEIKGKYIALNQLEELHPWLLSPGNCLRTQMINFCQLKTSEKKWWNYEGGDLHLLVKMVEQEGGYTLIPEHFVSRLDIDQRAVKRIKEHQPFRQIISISLHRNAKRNDLNKIIKMIKANKEISKHQEHLDLLPWDA